MRTSRTPDSPSDLRSVKLFRSLSADQLRRVAPLLGKRTLKKGEFLFLEGEPPDRLYLVIRGKVKILRQSPSGKDVILEIHGTGECVAEIAVIDGKPYPAAAQALTDARVLSIDRRDFLQLLSEYPGLSREIILGLGVRLREIISSLSSLAAQPVDKRLGRALLKFGERTGIPDSRGILLDLPLTRQDLADIIGATVETVIRSMGRMKNRGLITWQGKRIILRDPEALKELVNS